MQGERRYGDDKTIHRTGEVNVEVDEHGKVVGVWFRCQHLPFDQTVVKAERARELGDLYAVPPPSLKAVVLEDDDGR